MKGPNRSSAVMQQRHEAPNALDDFPTPPWATRALCRWLQKERAAVLGSLTVREPAANRGYMVDPLSEYFGDVIASDVHDYGAGFPVEDFLFGPAKLASAHWMITNPPFRLAQQFIERGFQTAKDGVAVLARSSFLEGIERYNAIYSKTPPTAVLQFSGRVVMHRGILRRSGEKYWDEEAKKTRTASTATSYAWLVWEKERMGCHTELHWISPCQKQLEREGDYEAKGCEGLP